MEQSRLPQLSAEEVRVLGALIEKSRTTPEYYPMTLNALTAACNQKTSRFPVTDFDEETVVMALNSLKGQSLFATAVGGGSRVTKYKHNFGTVFDVSDEEIAVLCLLMLRGAQTAGEINTNSSRLFDFKDLSAVNTTLQKLADSGFAKELPRRPGQKENRFCHLLTEWVELEHTDAAPEPARKHVSELEERVATLEREVAELKSALQGLL
jgi:hypothetical protein